MLFVRLCAQGEREQRGMREVAETADVGTMAEEKVSTANTYGKKERGGRPHRRGGGGKKNEEGSKRGGTEGGTEAVGHVGGRVGGGGEQKGGGCGERQGLLESMEVTLLTPVQTQFVACYQRCCPTE